MATQAERRTETRTSLLDAALDVLMESGLGGFTTTEVAQRSGRSQGALFRYFPTKIDLLAATVERLFVELRYSYEVQLGAALSDLRADADPVAAAMDVLWDIMSDRRLLAAFDLYCAARTDPDLATGLEPVVGEHVAHIRSLAHSLLPHLAAPGTDLASIEAWVEPTILCLQGLAIQELAQPDDERRRRVLSVLASQARMLLAADVAAAASTAPQPSPNGE